MRETGRRDRRGRRKGLREAVCWSYGEGAVYFAEACKPAAEELNAQASCRTCEDEPICPHRQPRIGPRLGPLWDLLNFSPGVWLHVPLGGIYALNYPYLRELADNVMQMSLSPEDYDLMRVFEHEHLKGLAEKRNEQPDGK